jgi:hypothetical protein
MMTRTDWLRLGLTTGKSHERQPRDWVGKRTCAGQEARVGCAREEGCARERLREGEAVQVMDWVGQQACAGQEARVGCTREKRAA